jgi:hypothetical protein
MDLYLANVSLQRVQCRYHGEGEVLVDLPPLSQVHVLANVMDGQQYTINNAVALYGSCGAVDAHALGNGVVAGLVTSATLIDVPGYIKQVAALNPTYAGRLGTALAEQGAPLMQINLVAVPNSTLA